MSLNASMTYRTLETGDTPKAPSRGAEGRVPGRVPGVPARVHLVGAGGAGMSGAARILTERGHAVSASDRADDDERRGQVRPHMRELLSRRWLRTQSRHGKIGPSHLRGDPHLFNRTCALSLARIERQTTNL